LLTAALLDGLFTHPAWRFSVVPNLDICDGYRGQNEFFRSLLGRGLFRLMLSGEYMPALLMLIYG
jgi:hypothetical protein